VTDNGNFPDHKIGFVPNFVPAQKSASGLFCPTLSGGSPFFILLLFLHFYLELTFAVVLHSEEENRAGQTAVLVVKGQKGGHLATDHPHSHLQNIRIAYR
jgi:hypothetical protein